MKISQPESPTEARAATRRQLLVLAGVVMISGMVALLAGTLAVLSVLRLGRDAATMRDVAVSAAGGALERKVEFNLGPMLTGFARLGLEFAPMDRSVREALGGIREVEMAVYRRSQKRKPTSGVDRNILEAVAQAMNGRDWERVVGVQQRDQVVAIYAPRTETGTDEVTVCFVVLHGRDLVVGRGRVRLDGLMKLAEVQQGRFLKARVLRDSRV